jgi:hypothetical protein
VNLGKERSYDAASDFALSHLARTDNNHYTTLVHVSKRGIDDVVALLKVSVREDSEFANRAVVL